MSSDFSDEETNISTLSVAQEVSTVLLQLIKHDNSLQQATLDLLDETHLIFLTIKLEHRDSHLSCNMHSSYLDINNIPDLYNLRQLLCLDNYDELRNLNITVSISDGYFEGWTMLVTTKANQIICTLAL